MTKQLQVKITVTEEELNQIQLVANKLGNKVATISKQLLMEKVRNYLLFEI